MVKSVNFDALTERLAKRGLILVAAFALIVAFAGLWTLPPLDRDEARFAQASAQMLETGDFVSIRFQNEERNKKPAGIHWLQAASVSAFSHVETREIWAYRIPSMAGAILAAAFVFLAAARLYDRRTGLVAGLLLASAPVVAAEATIAKTDAMLLALICLAQLAFVHVYARLQTNRATGWAWPALFWGAQGAAVLIKGPIAPMVAALTGLGLTLKRPRFAWLRSLRPISGVAILGLIGAPWAVAIGLETQGRFFTEALGGDMLGKVAAGQESHGAPPGYHVLLAPALFWPAAALIIPGLINIWRARATWQAHFLLAWLIPGWLVFEAAATKLPHYTLPFYPALAIMAARAACAPRTDDKAWPQKLGAAIYAAIGLGAAALIIVMPHLYGGEALNGALYLAAALIAMGTLAAAVYFWRGRRLRGAGLAALLSAFFVWTVMSAMLPSLDRLAVSPSLSEALTENSRHPIADSAAPVALAGYNEPSAIFLLGTQTRLLEGADAARALIAGEVSAAIVEAREAAAFQDALGAEAGNARALAVVDGLNYSNGKTVSLTIYAFEEEGAPADRQATGG